MLSSSLVLVLASLAMATAFTAVTYAKSCARLSGFPGLLQRVGIVSDGPCTTQVGGKACSGGTACTATVNSNPVPGTCKNMAGLGQPANCQCVANTVSKGLK